ncbi:uncharacterized protein N7498_000023 [Penicillium cinerascens]|uniref:Uncharacterized protein n=1 Tax=Penicillium cinerascens TaxID=70096 RepID=A0A9W9TD01_9EURO|nr:uncharacterized protein N7498_000023 [Penicillium cinerascens]KAJ5217924.1 hypothetical protein N7498_000023 [Penicillium cinerascens]
MSRPPLMVPALPLLIFQAATWHQAWFNICWERLESSPINAISSLGPVEIWHICRFVEPNFAEKLRKSGLDLGKSLPEDAAPGWQSVATRRDPEPMFSWLLSSGSKPPEGFLTYIATHNCTEAATWVMDHIKSQQDWCNAALAAAESADERSTTMLAIILPKFAAKWGIGQTLARDVVIKIVRGVCDDVAKCDLPMIFVDKEDYAIKKIRILGGSTGEGHVVGMNIMAGNARLYRLALELENKK